MNINSENSNEIAFTKPLCFFLKNKLDMRSMSIVGNVAEILVSFGSSVPLAARNYCNSTKNTDFNFQRISYGELLYCTKQDK